jgi:hypothetical protein
MVVVADHGDMVGAHNLNPCGVDELYNLRNDPGEMTNMGGRPAVRQVERRLGRRLLEHLRAVDDVVAGEKLKVYLASKGGG